MMVVMIPSNTLQFQYFLDLINFPEQSLPKQVLKISGYIFWVRLLWVKIIKNYYKSPLKVCELNV